ncbi:MAG TPA: hypothetical protein VMM77_06060 [Gemmatimonadaceae bacterium]|nr:hypothetical protein [Gemmatimonadaceae bacterium]
MRAPMIINLVPDFLAVLRSVDRIAAYRAYFEAHRPFLDAYWHNYVLDPDSPDFMEIVRAAVEAERGDLHALLAQSDLVERAGEVEEQCAALLSIDCDIDVILMVGVGAANAGELVINGKAAVFICVEHFTAVPNPTTQGLGLDPELLPLWLAHEMAHAVRYTSPSSRAEMRRLVSEAGGSYSYWDTGQRATLRELLVNEGLAVSLARAISPGHAEWEYYGYARRQYARIRELEQPLMRALETDLDSAGLGLRLRWLSGGMSESARRVDRHVIPERAGYYLGARMVAARLSRYGWKWSIRATAEELAGEDRAEASPATA